jgi:1-acyl-sn-glycerol-3-phosphate acyltransferase
VALTGTEALNRLGHAFFHRTHVLLTIGRPFRLPAAEGRITKEQRNALTRTIMGRIAALLPPSYRGVYAGEVDA